MARSIPAVLAGEIVLKVALGTGLARRRPRIAFPFRRGIGRHIYAFASSRRLRPQTSTQNLSVREIEGQSV